jgi:hypothetical protein
LLATGQKIHGRKLMSKYCVQCGERLTEDLAFCGNCGWQAETDLDSETSSVFYHNPEDEFISSDPEIYSFEAPSAPITVDFEPVPDTFESPAPQFLTSTFEQCAPPPPASTAVKCGKAILSAVLGILGFAFIIALIALIAVRPGSISHAVASSDVSWILEETDIGGTIGDGLRQAELIEEGIGLDNVRELIERENVTSELGRIAEQFARAIAEGDSDFYLTDSDIVDFVRAISPDILEELGIQLTSEDFDIISDNINEYVDLTEFRVGVVLEQSDVGFAVPHLLMSAYPMIIMAILCALIVFNVMLLHRKNIAIAFLTISIPFMLAGLLYIAAGLMLGPFSSLIDGDALSEILWLISGFSLIFMISGLICFVLGALAFIAFFHIKKARKQRPRKQAAKGGLTPWKMAGLLANAALLLTCVLLSLVAYMTIA